MKSVAIIYGFAEGDWQGRLMRPALKKVGFKLEKTPKLADIIIAHSGGCLTLPNTNKRQKVILIDPPYWPGKPILKSLFSQLLSDPTRRKQNGQLGYWLQKLLWNTYYIFRYPIRNIRMYFPAHNDQLFKILPSQEIVIIRNKNDPWCTPEAKKIAIKNNIEYYELPGTHEDCWLHPEKYFTSLI
jgi:hypothetical protein